MIKLGKDVACSFKDITISDENLKNFIFDKINYFLRLSSKNLLELSEKNSFYSLFLILQIYNYI
jgi:hypothetical protein